MKKVLKFLSSIKLALVLLILLIIVSLIGIIISQGLSVEKYSKKWGRFWGWDPKEVCSLVVWLIYTLYFHARYIQGWKGGRAAVISMIGFISTVATIFSNMILGGLHAY